MSDIKACFYSAMNLCGLEVWHDFIVDLEGMLGLHISHLDVRDPVRRKAGDAKASAEYICGFDEGEERRVIFGKFGSSGVIFSISLCKEVVSFPNSFSISFPEKFIRNEAGLKCLFSMFSSGNRLFKSFYSFCDYEDVIFLKKKATGFSVDLQSELIGVFWLTFFCDKYVRFFGVKDIDGLPFFCSHGDGGVTFLLGDSPCMESQKSARDVVERAIGVDFFVNPALLYDKPNGRFALLYKNLSN